LDGFCGGAFGVFIVAYDFGFLAVLPRSYGKFTAESASAMVCLSVVFKNLRVKFVKTSSKRMPNISFCGGEKSLSEIVFR